jgi:hypothetical protein
VAPVTASEPEQVLESELERAKALMEMLSDGFRRRRDKLPKPLQQIVEWLASLRRGKQSYRSSDDNRRS